MKKKITRPDGTIEELEGTAEELAELERHVQKRGEVSEESPKKKGKRILSEDVAQIARQLQDTVERALAEVIAKNRPAYFWTHYCVGINCQICRPPYYWDLGRYTNPGDVLNPWTLTTVQGDTVIDTKFSWTNPSCGPGDALYCLESGKGS